MTTQSVADDPTTGNDQQGDLFLISIPTHLSVPDGEDVRLYYKYASDEFSVSRSMVVPLSAEWDFTAWYEQMSAWVTQHRASLRAYIASEYNLKV